MSIPPVFAASALYDNLLQAALRQFFGRATFETEAIPSLSSDGRLSIEPTSDPSELTIRWFGSRHVLHVPARRPFTAHEVRLARAIGAVLSIRYRAVFDPRQMLEHGDLFRGSIEDRYVGAFVDEMAYTDPGQTRADLVATGIEVLRVAAMSSYENRSISSGILILDTDTDPHHRHRRDRRSGVPLQAGAHGDQDVLPAVGRPPDGLSDQSHRLRARRSRHRPALRTDAARRAVPDAVSIARAGHGRQPQRLRDPQPFARDQALRRRRAGLQLPQCALASARSAGQVRDVGRVGRQSCARGTAVPDGAGSRRRARRRAVRRPSRSRHVAADAGGTRRSARRAATPGNVDTPTRAQLLQMLQGRSATDIDPAVLSGLARTDGATVLDPTGRLLAVGAILLHTEPVEPHSSLAVEGARTTAAMAAGPLRRGAESERRRRDDVLRSAGEDLGHLRACGRSASSSQYQF